MATGPTQSSGAESEAERLTRNWQELLQELRVAQTGVQILTGFLLTIPFSSRFDELNTRQEYVYLAVLSGSVVATGLLVGPVAFHRTLFRRGERPWLVTASHRCARWGLATLALTVSGVMWLVVDIVVGTALASVAFAVFLSFFAALWVGVPMVNRRR